MSPVRGDITIALRFDTASMVSAMSKLAAALQEGDLRVRALGRALARPRPKLTIIRCAWDGPCPRGHFGAHSGAMVGDRILTHCWCGRTRNRSLASFDRDGIFVWRELAA